MAAEGCLTRAFIGLGTNLGDRLASLSSAVAALRRLEDAELVAVSGAYETSPVGPVTQGDFLNAVVELATHRQPRRLLDTLLAIEAEHGRRRSVRWGPRSLDLDLLLWGREQVDEPGLKVPHPYLTARRFVLEPLLEIAPELVHPVSDLPLADSLAELDASEQVRRLGPIP